MEHIYQKIQGWFTFQVLYSEIVSNLKDDSHIVEVGSWKGASASYMAVEILNSGKKIKFDCVDTWNGSEEHINPLSNFYEPLLATHDGLFNKFLENIDPIRSVISPIRSTSSEAAATYNDESLDFVFIDASHDYDNVCNDILKWYPKVKIGGILAGHDYNHPPVRRAVDDNLKNVISRPHELVWTHKK